MTTVPSRKVETTARVFFTAMAALFVLSIVALIVKAVSTGRVEFGAMLLAASVALVMVQEGWARRSEPLAIVAASLQHEQDERRRMLSAKAKAVAGWSAIMTGVIVFFVIELVPAVAAAFETVGTVQAVESVIGTMTLSYFLGRLAFAWMLNRKE